jgi:hypothetical protein
MNTALAPRKPFLPSDLPAERTLPRAILANAVAAVTNKFPADVAKQYWPRDVAVGAFLQRSATVPATTTQAGWAAELSHSAVGAFLGSLQDSAAASLFSAAPRYDLSGIAQLSLPRASSTTGGAAWIAEGAPIPVPAGAILGPTLGPVRKVAIIESCTREVSEATPEGGESIITTLVTDAVTRQLDIALFSSTAGSAVQPAGLLNGITPSAASAAAGISAAGSDLRTLTDAIVTAGGSGGALFFTSPGRVLTLKGYFPALADRFFGSASIPSGTIIAVDPRAFASALGGDPEIRVTLEATVHFEDSAPQPIGIVGAPNVVAAPTRSACQSDLLLIRCILRICWCLRIAGTASWINTGLSW